MSAYSSTRCWQQLLPEFLMVATNVADICYYFVLATNVANVFYGVDDKFQ